MDACQRRRIKLDVPTFKLNGFSSSSPTTQISSNKNVNHKTSKIASHDLFILLYTGINSFAGHTEAMNAKK